MNKYCTVVRVHCAHLLCCAVPRVLLAERRPRVHLCCHTWRSKSDFLTFVCPHIHQSTFHLVFLSAHSNCCYPECLFVVQVPTGDPAHVLLCEITAFSCFFQKEISCQETPLPVASNSTDVHLCACSRLRDRLTPLTNDEHTIRPV